LTGSTEVWIGTDAEGVPADLALTQSVSRNGSPDPALGARLLRTPNTFEVYDPATNTLTESAGGDKLRGLFTTPGTPLQDLEDIFMGTMVTQKLGRALAGGVQPADLQLQQQTLDGVPVYALSLAQPGGQTYYFNAQSYR